MCKTNPIPSGEIPQHSSILLFHHSKPMSIVQNEPNFPMADFGLRIGARLAAGCPPAACRPTPADETCKTNPICPPAPRRTRPPGPASRGNCAKRTQFPGRPEGRGTRANRAKRTQFAAERQGRPSSRPEALAMPPRRGAIAPNKPNSCHYADPEIGVPGRVNRAKRSQFFDCGLRIADSGQPCGGTPLRAAGPGPVVQTNPIGRSESCETKPNLGTPGVSGGRRAGGAYRAKQSQLAAGEPLVEISHYSGILRGAGGKIDRRRGGP